MGTLGRQPDLVDVLIVDDQAPFRRVARAVVEATPGFQVVAMAETGEEAVSLAGRMEPALVLMDITMPGIDGIEAARRILRARPRTGVILLSTHELADLPADAGSCGAIAYVHKEEFGSPLLRQLWAEHVG